MQQTTTDERIALFPGSFDPITIAHVDILARALPLFTKVYIGIGLNSNKEGLISREQREQMIRAVYAGDNKIEVISYEGLTVEFCSRIGASYIIRGIRSTSDFEYEKAISQKIGRASCREKVWQYEKISVAA